MKVLEVKEKMIFSALSKSKFDIWDTFKMSSASVFNTDWFIIDNLTFYQIYTIWQLNMLFQTILSVYHLLLGSLTENRLSKSINPLSNIEGYTENTLSSRYYHSPSFYHYKHHFSNKRHIKFVIYRYFQFGQVENRLRYS